MLVNNPRASGGYGRHEDMAARGLGGARLGKKKSFIRK
jgi:hypothetical protein